MAAQLNPADRRVLYFYGVTQAKASKPLKVTGVDLQSPIEAIEREGVICWVSRVSAAEFQVSLARNMENLDWLTTAGVAHQRAIGAIAQQVDILPARFGTVFRDENSLHSHLRERVRDMESDFKRIRDSEEWGIKIFEAAPVAAMVPKVRSGKEYLQAKAALLPRKQSERLPEAELAEFQDALSGVAEESASAGKISSGQRGVLFQASLLVKRHNRARFEAVLKRFSQKWAQSRRIECSGPWPPYSFVSRDLKSL